MLIRYGALRLGSSVGLFALFSSSQASELSSICRTVRNFSIMSPSFQEAPSIKTLGDLLPSIDNRADNGRGVKHIIKSRWHIPAGSYTPRQIVDSCSPLLEAVLYHLGSDPTHESAREMLLENLASNLALETRESTLLLAKKGPDAGRREMANQATKIGKTIVQYARTSKHPEFDQSLDIRSPCEGHLLNHGVAGLMFGPRSKTHLMQLFNEYLHQMVLLRDALLPFENYEDVIIPISGGTGRMLGLRGTQQTRKMFIAELMSRQISQDSVFQVARSLLAPGLPSTGGYAFQYSHGTVLPAFVAGSKAFRLLRYFPAKLDTTAAEVLFDYELEDYYIAPRTEISKEHGVLAAHTWPPTSPKSASTVSHFSLAVASSRSPERSAIRLLQLRIEFEHGVCTAVDLGQMSRGLRYAYNSASSTNGEAANNDENTTGFSVSSYQHTVLDVLTKSESGLITSKNPGIHIILVNNPILRIALLGKIYPENSVLLPTVQSPSNVEKVGKSFSDSAKFVIYTEEN